MNKLGKILRFIQFTLDGKLLKLAKKMSNEELTEIYVEFSPLYYNPMCVRDAALGALVVYSVANELKRRYPYSIRVQKWNPLEQVNLKEIIGANNE